LFGDHNLFDPGGGTVGKQCGMAECEKVADDIVLRRLGGEEQRVRPGEDVERGVEAGSVALEYGAVLAEVKAKPSRPRRSSTGAGREWVVCAGVRVRRLGVVLISDFLI